MYYVYTITNLVNYKIYVGQTTVPKNRWAAHKCESYSNRIRYPIHRAMKKYGIDKFHFSLIEVCDTPDQVDKAEIYWIKQFDSTNSASGYNLAIGGNVNRGWHHSELTKKKISESNTGVFHPKHTEEWKNQSSIRLTGRNVSKETRQKMSSAQKGKSRWTDEQKAQMSIDRKGILVSQETKNKMSASRKGKYTGENNSHSKLTWLSVTEIRIIYALGSISMANLAKKYKVSSVLISKIVNNKIWIK